MAINSRTKGAAFERLIVRKINECLEQEGIEDRVSRNFDQSWKGGLADIYYRNFAIECKRYKNNKTNMYKQSWWDQVVASAGDKYIPLLIYKFDRKPIYAVIPAYLVSNAPEHYQVTYMCPLEDLCKDIKNILRKANV
jgi:hypothetical protein|tara:strand:+ start:67 stop:480 length:414 start_codon:yes stop_codon:yes gene_type:complete